MAALGSDTMGSPQHGSVKVVTDVIQGEQPDHLSGKIRIIEHRNVPDEPDLTGRRNWRTEEIEEVNNIDPYKRLEILFAPNDDDSSADWRVNISFHVFEYFVHGVSEDIRRRPIAEVLTVDNGVGVDRIGEPVAEYISEQINKDMGSHENRRKRIEEQLDNTDEIVAAFNEYSADELLDVFESEN